MLDIKFVRENPEIVKQNIRNKFQDRKLPMVDEVIALDAESRAVKQEADTLRAERNKISKQIGGLMAQGRKDEAMAMKEQVTRDSERLAELEKKEEELGAAIKKIMMTLPNIIDRILRFRTIRRSWSGCTALIWTAPAGWPATAFTICWAISRACIPQFWPMPATL